MRTPETLLADPQNLLRSSQATSSGITGDQLERAIQAVKEVFKKLTLSKGHRFTSMFTTTEILREAERLWAIEFIHHGLTPRMLAIGTQKAITKPGFCPDLPEFIALCRPTAEDVGLPPMAAAYAEACRNSYPGAEVRWSHPAVYHAAQ